MSILWKPGLFTISHLPFLMKTQFIIPIFCSLYNGIISVKESFNKRTTTNTHLVSYRISSIA